MINISNDTWIIDYELTLKTVGVLYKFFKNNCKKIDKIWIVDFAKASKIDSAGLSLIIEYIKYAKRHNIELKLKNIDQKTISLANVHGLKNILEEYIN
ncbi:MAG: STAS domain-containing protein [Francisella sp.]